MIQTEWTLEWSWKGQALPSLASSIPRDLYTDNSNGRGYCRMAVGLAYKKYSKSQSFHSPTTTGWARRNAIGPSTSERDRWDQRRKACPLIPLHQASIQKAIDMPGWEEKNGLYSQVIPEREKGFIAYSLPSDREQMQSLQKKGIIGHCLP